MKKCTRCTATEKETKIINNKKHGYLCARCYQREMLNPHTYELPSYGEVSYSPEGKPICHICGKAFDKLIAHVWQIHDISATEYKKEFGLDLLKGIMSEESTELARKRVFENYEVSIKQNLLKGGKETRFEEGHDGRTKDQVSEQTRRRLAKQLRINEKKGLENKIT